MSEFLRSYGTFILATYGVIQVWLIALWKYFRSGRLSIYKTGRLEIGYSNFGPTLALNGTLRAERKTVFVREIQASVTKVRDGSSHQFEWMAFRSTQLRVGATDSMTLELPAGFNVSPEQPYRYHIFFSDRQTRLELESVLVQVLQAWRGYVLSKPEQIKKALGTPGVTQEALALNIYDSEFSRTSREYQQAWELLTRKNYWEAGPYALRMTVHTPDGRKRFVETWQFILGEEDFQNLRLNALATLREICLGQARYNFVYPEYR